MRRRLAVPVAIVALAFVTLGGMGGAPAFAAPAAVPFLWWFSRDYRWIGRIIYGTLAGFYAAFGVVVTVLALTRIRDYPLVAVPPVLAFALTVMMFAPASDGSPETKGSAHRSR